MKKVISLLLLLLGGSMLCAQNCDNYKITTKYDNFDSITVNYKQILLKGVGQEAQSLPPFFKDMATCWLDRVKNYPVFKSYSIEEESLTGYPETVFLVFNSRSLSTKEEKQNWFNLMPMMNEEQMAKLYDILEREMLKINAIELKYEDKRAEIRNRYTFDGGETMASSPTDTTFAYLGYYITVDELSKERRYEVDYWKKIDGRYVNEEGEKLENIMLVDPSNLIYIKGRVDKNQQWVIDFYENVVFSYFDNLRHGKSVLPADKESQSYMIKWWNQLMEKYSEEDKVRELNELAEIAMEDLIDDEQEKKSCQTIRHYYLFDQSLKKGEFGKAAAFFAVVINNREGVWSPQKYVSSLYVPVLCDEEPSWSGDQKIIETAYLDWFHRMDETAVYEKAQNAKSGTSIMVSDYYLQFGNNNELKKIVQTINTRLKIMHLKGELRYGDDVENDWYSFLNQSYMNGTFDGVYDFDGLKEKVEDAGFAPNDAPMVEYVCYYCLYQMIHTTPSKDGHVSQLLRRVLRICNDRSSGAYGYIEKYIAKDLELRLQQRDSYKIPYVVFVSPKISNPETTIYKTTEALMKLSIVVGNGSESLYNAKVYADSIYGKDRFDKEAKDAWVFNKTIRLKPGENLVLIEYVDTKKNSFCDTLKISYTIDYTVRKDLALLFAVDDYSKAKGYYTLSNPIRHAEILAEKLYNYGFDTIIYRNPDRKKIIKTLRNYAESEYGEYDQLLVFFSGHGKYDRLTDQGFIVPPDGDIEDPFGTMVTYNNIYQTLDHSNCQHVLFISDACHSGSFIREKRGELPQGNQGSIMKHKSRYFIGSVTAEDESPDESELMDLLIQIFDHSDKDVIDFYYIQSVLGTSKGMEKVAGPWGDNKLNSDFYFNRRN